MTSGLKGNRMAITLEASLKWELQNQLSSPHCMKCFTLKSHCKRNFPVAHYFCTLHNLCSMTCGGSGRGGRGMSWKLTISRSSQKTTWGWGRWWAAETDGRYCTASGEEKTYISQVNYEKKRNQIPARC